MKSQSAMEYLMTYGWAILIIAVVLGILFQLGIFSGGNLSPGAQPGACQVENAGGEISLVGQCDNSAPEFVAVFSGVASSKITIPATTRMQSSSFAVAGWGYVANIGTDSCGVQNLVNSFVTTNGGNGRTGFFLEYGWTGGIFSAVGNTISFAQIGTGNTNTYYGAWSFIAYTYNVSTSTELLYVNGKQVESGTIVGSSPNLGTIVVGGGCENGYIANIQIYNTTLTSSEISSLYSEGIGGAPVRPQNIVGWWPLNGNANDYSGGNDGGTASGSSFSGSWQSATGYSPP